MAEQTKSSCIAVAKAGLKLFTDSDIEKYISHVFDKMNEFSDMRGAEAVNAAIKAVNNEHMQGFMEAMQTKIDDANKLEKASTKIKEGKQTLLQSLFRRIAGMGDNVEAAQRAAHRRLSDKFFNVLTDDETGFAVNPANETDIMRAIDKKPASDLAKGIADKFKLYIKGRNVESVSSGAVQLMEINKDRFLRAIHDPSKILRGGRSIIKSALSKGKYSIEQARDVWKQDILPLLDLKKTFRDFGIVDVNGNVDMNKVHDVMDKIFDNITTGKTYLFNQGIGKQNMFFYWKDMESWNSYNKKYGHGNFIDAMHADVQASSNKIGMAEMFGSNPAATYNDLAKVEKAHNPVSALKRNQAEMAFKWLAGVDRAPVSASLSSFGSAVRSLTSAKLMVGRTTLLGLPDIANGIMFAHRWGYSYFKSYGTYLSGLFNAINTADRQFIANEFKEITNVHQGYLSRFIDASDPGHVINNMNMLLYKGTFNQALDKGSKVSALLMQSRILAENSGLEFNALNRPAQDMLSKFGVTADEWNVIRENTVKFQGKQHFTMDSVDKLTKEQLRRIYKVEGKTEPLYRLKNDLYRKVYSMFDVASENATLSPSQYMKCMTKLGVRSGTVGGEILGSIMQFKMFALEFADRIMYQGLLKADGVQNKLIFGGLLVGATLPMSWLSMYLDNLGKGKSMPEWERMNYGERLDFTKNLLTPGAGILGNFFGHDGRFDVGSFFKTPALTMLWDAINTIPQTIEGLSTGDTAKIGKAFAKVGKAIIPGTSMPFVSPYIREMFGDKPYLQHGQRQLYGA